MKIIKILFTVLLMTGMKLQVKSMIHTKPVFHGIVKFDNGKKSNFDTLLITYDRPYTPWGTRNLSQQVTTDKYGKFNFTLPSYDQAIKMEILVRVNTTWKRTNACFVKSGDNIKVEILKSKENVYARFYGKNSYRYNIASLLAEIDDEYTKKLYLSNLNSPDDIGNKLKKFNELTEKMERKRIKIISDSKLSVNEKKMITYEYGEIVSSWNNRLYDCYNRVYKNNKTIRTLIRQSYDQNKNKFRYKADPLMSLCPIFIAKLAGMESKELVLENDTDLVKLENYYNLIKVKYNGLLRERLIADLFLGYTGFNEETQWNVAILDSLMKDGEKYITLPLVKIRFSSAVRLNKGEKLFSTVLLDENNKEISTDALKGKVIFIDIWGTGCSACARFYQKFHKDFYPLMKDNKDFVYLSISTDKAKEKWERAINSGRYTSKQYLNVHFGELGLDHPFAKYYNIEGAPFLLVIGKNGNIFSSVFKSDENVKDMILAALKEKDLTL